MATSFAGGSGTSSNPYLIETPAQLGYLSYYYTITQEPSTYFKLINNINLSGNDFQTIQTNSLKKIYLDGNHMSISNLRINNSSEFGGLFKNLYGEVHDITFVNPIIDSNHAATIAYTNYGMIYNIQIINGTVSSKNNFSGGIVSKNDSSGIITNCFYRGNVSFTPKYQNNKSASRNSLVTVEIDRSYWGGPFNSRYYHDYSIYRYNQYFTTISQTGVIFSGGLVGNNAGECSNSYFIGSLNGSVYEYRINQQVTPNKNFRSRETKVECHDKYSHAYYCGYDLGTHVINSNMYASYDEVNNYSTSNYTFKTTLSDSNYKYPYPLGHGSFQNFSNCYFVCSSNMESSYYGAISKTTETIKTAPLGSAFEVCSYINDGFPYIKAFYWQDNT